MFAVVLPASRALAVPTPMACRGSRFAFLAVGAMLALASGARADGWCANDRMDISPWDSNECGIDRDTYAARCWVASSPLGGGSLGDWLFDREWLTISGDCMIEKDTYGLHCDVQRSYRSSFLSPHEPLPDPYSRRWIYVDYDSSGMCAIDEYHDAYCFGEATYPPSGHKWLMVEVSLDNDYMFGIDRDTY